MIKLSSKVLFLIISSILLLGISCNPVYNLGNTAHAPIFDQNNQLEVNAAGNTNNVFELNLSYKGKTPLYYSLSGGVGKRVYEDENTVFAPKYITRESMYKVGMGVYNPFGHQFGLGFNAGVRRNRNVVYVDEGVTPSVYYTPDSGDFTNYFRGLEIIPYKHFGKKHLVATLGLAIRNDFVYRQRGEFQHQGELHSEIIKKGTSLTYYDPFLILRLRTKVIDVSLNMTYSTDSTLPIIYIESPLRFSLSFQKRFQLKSKR